jgi:hypothetical protein
MIRKIAISFLISVIPAALFFLNGAGLVTEVMALFSFAIPLLLLAVFFGLRKVFAGIIIVFIILVSLEFVLVSLDKQNLLNFDGRKNWLRGSKLPNRVLVCYPSNPEGYFDINLRDITMRNRYGIEGDLWQWSPYCVEEIRNSLGYREREITEKSIRPRVIFLGDSFTLGEGVRSTDRFSDILRTQYWQKGFEVYNFASTGAGVAEVYQRLFKDALNYSADIVLYCFTLNDPILTGNLSHKQLYINDLMNVRYYNSDLYKFFDAKIRENGTPVFIYRFYKMEKYIAFNSKVFFVLRQAFFDRLITRETISWYREMYTAKNPGWEMTKDLIVKMQGEAQKRGAFFAVVILPIFYNFQHYPFQEAHKEIRDFCNQNRIDVLDTLDSFRGVDYRKCMAHPLDYHPSRYAHAILAASISSFIENAQKTGRLK